MLVGRCSPCMDHFAGCHARASAMRLILLRTNYYITSLEEAGVARPWMLSWRADFGTSGLVEPDNFELLVQLLLSEGFLSDPNLMSVEKLTCCQVPESFLDSEYPHLVAPFSVGYLKGWKRSLTLLFSLAAIRELSLEAEISNKIRETWLQVGSAQSHRLPVTLLHCGSLEVSSIKGHHYNTSLTEIEGVGFGFAQVSFGTIHVNFAFKDADVRSQIMASRGCDGVNLLY